MADGSAVIHRVAVLRRRHGCCTVFQFDAVKVSVGGENVTSLLPVRDGVTVTFAVGWLSSTTV